MPKYADPSVYPVGTPAATDNVMTRTAAGADGNFALGNLAGIAGAAVASDQSVYLGSSGWASYSLTAAGRALSGVAGTANTFPYFSATNVVTLGSVTSTGLSILSAANQAAARTAIQAVGSVGNETVGGIKTMTSEIRIQNVAPGFWLDESDGTNGFFAVVDGGAYQLQVRDANFGPFVRQVLQITASGGTFGIGATNVRPLDTSTSNLGIAANRWANVHSDRFTAYTNISPATDNSVDIGTGSIRIRTYYGVNSAINTSDARLKTAPRSLSDAERKAGSELARLPAIWEWLTGDRLHAGPTVQAAIAVMKAHGLDPFAYSFICHDEWEAEPATYDEDGNELTPARDAGDRYSFRKEELLCFMVSALAAENDLQAAKIEAMDARLAAVEARA